MLKKLLSFVPLVSVFLLSACNSTEKIDPYANHSAKQIYNTAHTHLIEEQYEASVNAYEGLEAHFPFGNYTEQGQLEIIYAYYRYGNHPAAIASADRFIRLHPRSPNLDYAYYMKGVIKFNENVTMLEKYLPINPSARDLDAEKEAYNYFAEFIRRFPESQYAPDARQRMLYIRNSMAEANFYVALYYYNRGAYLSSAVRAKDIISNYEGAPIMPDALRLLYKSYRKLGFDDLAEDVQRVIALNYPKKIEIEKEEE